MNNRRADQPNFSSSIFLTFSGNCKSALTFYQSCFGGQLHFEMCDNVVGTNPKQLVISGCLRSDNIIIRGSDLVYDQGRVIGNYMAIYVQCASAQERNLIKNKILVGVNSDPIDHCVNKLIDIVDQFQVRWILGL